jgi:hypothetical protein
MSQLQNFKRIEGQRVGLDLEAYKMRSAVEGDYHTLIRENTLVYEGDTLMIAYIELDLDCTAIVNALNRIHYSKSYRTAGLPTTSRIFGFDPRKALRKDYCSSTALATEQPEEHAIVCDYAAKVSDYYQSLNPDLYGQHAATTEEHVHGDYRIKQSPFTSGIINKNNPLKYHFDTGNFADVWSAMLVFKHQVTGGYLSVPEYGLGFQLKHNSLFLFDGQGLLHGVTPIKRHSPDAFRYSIVYYSLRQMWNCQPLSEELLRIREKRVEREEKRAAGVKLNTKGSKP